MGMIAVLAQALVIVSGPVTVDWTQGVIRVEAGAGPSLRAPSPQVARVAAERQAKKAAVERLIAAVEKLPLAGGGTVGAHLARHPDGRKVLDKLCEELQPSRARHASDGGIEIELRVPLSKIAQAIGVDTDASETHDKPRAARIAVATGKLEPAVLPQADLRFFRSVADAKKEKDWLGPHPQTIKIRTLSDGDLRGGPVAVVIEK